MKLSTFLIFLCSFAVLCCAAPGAMAKNTDRLLSLAKDQYPSDSSLYYAKLAYDEAAKINDKQTLVGALILQSEFFRFKSLLDSSLVKTEEGLKIAWDLNDPLMTAGLLLEKGRTLRLKKDHDSALECLMNSLNIYSLENNDKEVARLHIELAEFYRSISSFHDAEYHLSQAFTINTKKTLPEDILIHLYSRTAAVKNETGKPDSALLFSTRALELSKKAGNYHMQAVSLNELGFLYENKGSAEAQKYYQQAIDIWNNLGNDRYKFNAIVNLARFYHKNRRTAESNYLLESILPAAEENKWSMVLTPVYDQLATNYRDLGDLVRAYDYRLKHNDASIQQFRQEYNKEIADIKTKYEVERKNRQLVEKEGEIKAAKIAYDLKSREEKFLLFGTILLALLAGGLVYLSMQKSKTNKKLSFALHEKELLFRELHHRVKNNLAVLSGLLHLQQVHSEDDKAIAALQESQNRIRSMSIIHQNLYRHENLTDIAFEDYVSKLVQMLEQSILPSGKEVQVELNCDKVILNVEKAMPLALILNELVTNSFKYSFNGRDKAVIGVKIVTKEKACMLEIYDDGPGLPVGFDLKNTGTLGMQLVEMLADQIDAKVVYNNSGRSCFSISFDC
jgi:two-component system, sensor histidine kinase PdtaS